MYQVLLLRFSNKVLENWKTVQRRDIKELKTLGSRRLHYKQKAYREFCWFVHNVGVFIQGINFLTAGSNQAKVGNLLELETNPMQIVNRQFCFAFSAMICCGQSTSN